MSFWSELRRRKVVRATLAYLAAAFVVAQVTQLLIDALELPENLLRIVVIVEIALLPLIIAAAWAFDWSSAGVHQTDSPAPPIRWRRIAPAALATIVLLGVGLVYAMRRPAAELDANLVAVLPFRVSGSNDITYLREGMMDLLSAKLTGEGGPRAADPRSTMSALKAGGHDPSEISDDDALDVARLLGAAYVLLGSAVGTTKQLTISATLTDVRNGKEAGRFERTGSADTLAAFIDHFAAELLSVRAGENRRLTALTSTSLPALRAYLAAQSDYRGSRFESAKANFRRAVELDSTFALAAMGHINSTGWGAAPDTMENRSRRLLVRYADRLGEIDRAMARALVGSAYPDVRAAKERLDLWAAVVGQAPDRSDAWFLYGDVMLHVGGLAGHRDFMEQGRRAMNRSLQMDSAHMPALVHLIDFALMERDTASLKKLNVVRTNNRVSLLSHQTLPMYRTLGDSANLRVLRAAMDTMSYGHLYAIALAPMVYGDGMEEAKRATMLMVERATLPEERRDASQAVRTILLNYGMQARASELAQIRMDASFPDDDFAFADPVMDALFGDGDTIQGRRAVEHLRRFSAGAPQKPRLAFDCAVDMWDLWHGGSTRALQTARALRALPQEGEDSQGAFLCALILEATHANLTNSANAAQTLAALDQFLAPGPAADGGILHVGNIVAARLWERGGDVNAAYRAISRRAFHPAFFDHVAVMIGEQARLAALTGDSRRAAQLYVQYLQLRKDADPSLRPKVDAARRELARLTRDRARN